MMYDDGIWMRGLRGERSSVFARSFFLFRSYYLITSTSAQNLQLLASTTGYCLPYFFIPYVLYRVTFGIYACGLAVLGKKYGSEFLKVAGYALAAALLVNIMLGGIIAPAATTAIVRGVLFCATSVALLNLYPLFGRLIVWTSMAGFVTGIATLFNIGDFPSVIFLALGPMVLLRGTRETTPGSSLGRLS
jgi:hypothetical protein